MKATGLGRLLGFVALVLFAVAFVRGSIAPALAGLALMAFMDGARRTLRIGNVQATRKVAPVVRVDEPFEVDVRVEADAPIPLRVRDEEPPGAILVAQESTQRRQHVDLRVTYEAKSPGQLEWTDVVVGAVDGWGLWTEEVHVLAPATTKARPEGYYLEQGRRQGRRNTVQKIVKSPLASEALPEVKMVRPYMPMDRVRDIDWRVTARTGDLHTRDRERASPRRFLILLDATRSMRRPSRVPKIRTAIRVATGVAGAAQGAGVSAGLVAFHENGIQTVGDAATRASLNEVIDRLGRLPPVEGADGISMTTDLDRTVTGDERRFLRTISSFGQQMLAAPSLDAALGALTRLTTDHTLVVAIMDGEVNPRRVEVAVGRLQRLGHQVVVVVPATGSHHVTKQDAGPVLGSLREAHARRARLKRHLATLRVPMLVVHPDEEEEAVREVAKCAV